MSRKLTFRARTSVRAIVALAVAALVFEAFPKSPATIVSEFSQLLSTSTTGRYGQLVWCRRNAVTGSPDGGDILQGLDTREGVIRNLVNGNNFGGDFFAPSFTWDGKYVIYYDWLNITLRRYEWATGKDTILLRNFEGGGRCWQSSDGKQWVLTVQYKGNTAMGAALYRVNVNNPTEQVLLLNDPNVQRPGYGGAANWASMSVDGKYVSCGLPDYGALSWFATATPAPTSVPQANHLNPNGCYPTISRDNQYHILHTDDLQLTHQELYIQDLNHNKILQKPLYPGVFSSSGETFESLRWSNDVDYCTFHSSGVGLNNWTAIGYANPKVVRISDLKYVAINDTCAGLLGDCDLYLTSGTATTPGISRIGARSGSGARSDAQFDLRGRTLSRENARGTGLRIRPGDSGRGLIVRAQSAR